MSSSSDEGCDMTGFMDALSDSDLEEEAPTGPSAFQMEVAKADAERAVDAQAMVKRLRSVPTGDKSTLRAVEATLANEHTRAKDQNSAAPDQPTAAAPESAPEVESKRQKVVEPEGQEYQELMAELMKQNEAHAKATTQLELCVDDAKRIQNSANVIKVSQVEVDALDEGTTIYPVSYTHLTLPTKRIV
eukprot:TRINITY_DN2864_c0_g1_i1.p1 TRINITY_DN2864_c0_g1~~TRINITY_DN2864_c0_g1_i1.p1  ORF type:complete len:189 (-),score=53.01 TRINITY_DN2864_c0_g1_i1:57-623(-)